MLNKLEEMIVANIKKIPEKPLSFFLSGGIDSSLVLALLRKVYPQVPVCTYSLALNNSYPDILFAREMAERFHTQHKELILSEAEYMTYLEEYKKIKKHSFKGDVNIFILCKIAKNFSREIITGDGGDECFGGYWLHEYPLGHREIGQINCFDEIHSSPRKHLEDMVKLGFRDFYYKERSEESDYNAVWEYFIKIMAPRHLSPLLYIGNSLDVNIYTPLYSESLIDYVRSLPYKERIGRKIEKKLAEKHLPKSIIERESIGFDSALDKKSVAN